LITNVDACLRNMADWYVQNRHILTEPELKTILMKHCGSEKEVEKFSRFMKTRPGQIRFRNLLLERKEQSEIARTQVSSLGFMELEIPVALAVETMVDENPWSSGFHRKLNQRWTIVFRGRASDKVVKAAKAAGLDVNFREAPKRSGQILTDVSLPDVGITEIEKAKEVFDRFAELYEKGS